METSHRIAVVFEQDANGVAHIPRHVNAEVLGVSGLDDCGCCRKLFVGRVGVGVPGGLLVADPGSSANYCKDVELAYPAKKCIFPETFKAIGVFSAAFITWLTLQVRS